MPNNAPKKSQPYRCLCRCYCPAEKAPAAAAGGPDKGALLAQALSSKKARAARGVISEFQELEGGKMRSAKAKRMRRLVLAACVAGRCFVAWLRLTSLTAWLRQVWIGALGGFDLAT